MSTENPSEPKSPSERRFRAAMKKILAVPKAEILRREAEDRTAKDLEKKRKRAA